MQHELFLHHPTQINENFQQKYIHPFIKGKSLTFFRYIDDILSIWTRTKSGINLILNGLIKKYRSIKREYKVSQNRIAFLDTEIYLHNSK